ncbi:MAG: hypothetical protein C4547_08765 [Phycisphaerales bacterium]|nr:MAG: hypothetical protein C4547_08765 [Phycisphaerales bacterium]
MRSTIHCAVWTLAGLVAGLATAGASFGQEYIEGVNDHLPIKPGWSASANHEHAFLWTAQNTFDMTEMQWHSSAVRSGTIRVREVEGGRPGKILRSAPFSANNIGWHGAAFDDPLPVIAGEQFYVTYHSVDEYQEFVADGGVRMTFYWTINGTENWSGPWFDESTARMIKFYGFRGVDCDAVKKLKVKCERGKLVATVKSSLPEGSRLTLDNNGDRRDVSIDRKGKGKAKWKNQSGSHTVEIIECEEFIEEVNCG